MSARSVVAVAVLGATAAGLGLGACDGDATSPGDGGPDVIALDAAGPEAGVDAAPDAPTDAATGCDTSAAFGAPVLVTELDGPADDIGARLSADGLTVYFTSNRALGDAATQGPPVTFGTSVTIYRATRTAVDQPFGAPALATDLDVGDSTGFASLTTDGLTAYFAAQWDGGAARLLSATRATTTDPFGGATAIPGIAGNLSDNQPYVLGDGSALYFVSARTIDAGFSGIHLFRSGIDAGAVGAPELVLARTNDAGLAIVVFSPVVSADELTLYFGSPGPGFGSHDVWRATRASTSDPFSNPAPVAELDSTSDDMPSYLTPDGCAIYLFSDRPGGAGQWDIYRASKPAK